MKKSIFSFLMLLIGGLTMNLTAQMTEGVITMEITEITSSDEAIAAQMQMLKGTETKTFFTDEKYKTDMSMMGGMVNMGTIVENNTGRMDMLMDMMGQKMWIQTDMDEAGKDKPSQDDVEISYDKEDTKEILGYKCYRMNLSSPAMPGGKVVAYITEDIKSNAKFIQGYEKISFAGFPLEVSVVSPQLTMKMETTDLQKAVPDGAFDVDFSAYKKMTLEEFTEQMGGMGGFGF